MNAQTKPQSGGMFSSLDQFSLNQDFKMIHKANKAGWLTEERRGELLERAFNLALAAANEGDVESFTKLAKFLESTFEFDIKRAIAEQMGSQPTKYTPSRIASGDCLTLEQRRTNAIERAQKLGLFASSNPEDN